MQVTYITPDTPEALAEHYEAIRFLHAFLPDDVGLTPKQFIDRFAGWVTLCYSGKIPLGWCVLYPVQGNSKKSVQIHGVYRQDLKMLLGRQAAKALVDHVLAEIFRETFIEARKEKMIAKVSKEDRAAKVFLRKYGFTLVPNTERGMTIWKLERNDYLGVVKV